jgi:exopolyphosphatase/pppGpp-phosphohydrolase
MHTFTSSRDAHTHTSRRDAHTLTHIHIMNMLTFNSPEQDVIYDALIMHMQCTDDDSVANTCHTIINKMHMHSVMNEEQV